MTQKKLKNHSTSVRKFTKKVTATKKKSIDFLVRAGICNNSGTLKRPFK